LSEDLDRDGWVGPTPLAHISSRATRTHIIVNVHVDIEHHFFVRGHKCFLVRGVVSVWLDIEDCTNIDFEWNSIHQSFLELFSSFEAQIPAVHIVFQGERKLTLVEIVALNTLIDTF